MERLTKNSLIYGVTILSFLIQIVPAEQMEFPTTFRSVNSSSLQDQPGNGTGPVDAFPPAPRIDCDFACARRCLKASRQKLCTRACGTCCLKCQCVPIGTSGNKEICPCYASLRTHNLKPKCP